MATRSYFSWGSIQNPNLTERARIREQGKNEVKILCPQIYNFSFKMKAFQNGHVHNINQHSWTLNCSMLTFTGRARGFAACSTMLKATALLSRKKDQVLNWQTMELNHHSTSKN